MPELLYIDEVSGQRNLVLQAAVRSKHFSQTTVKGEEPRATIAETIELIESLGCKVLIADFRLKEFAPHVEFNGDELISAFLERHEGFPCFVTTARADEAADGDIDVNLVFSKSEALREDDDVHTLPFFLRVRKKIEEYEEHLMELRTAHESLITKLLAGELQTEEAKELISIDSELERMLRTDSALPAEVKQIALQPMTDLIAKTTQLLEDITAELEQKEDGS
jgi:hypothetical protein